MKLFEEHDSRLAALEKKVGIFIFIGAGLLLLVFAVIAIEQGMFASTTPLRFHTDDAGKLHEGMEIRLSGFKVGKVVSIVLMDDGMIEANFVIQKQYLTHIRHGAKLRLVEQGLLGDSILEVVPDGREMPALVMGEVLPFERQLGMDALAHDLVDRLKPILDSVNITANQPDGLVQHAKSVAVQVEKASEAAIELMKQIQVAIGTSNVKINQALDKTDALLVKTDGVLDNVQRITSEAGKITAASAENLLPLIRDGRVAAEDVRNIIGASKEVWPIRNFIDTGGENMLPMDSYGVTHVQPK
jgi:phospholipid/cholesterol/gamma-HCH transport system substrate-binding protein